ncbi:MAG: type II secretion system F family protein [Kineosporiaceae bacterium]
MTVLTWVLATAAVLLLLLGIGNLAFAGLDRHRLAGAVLDDHEARRQARYDAVDGWFARTRPGAWLQQELILAGSTRPPLTVVLAGLTVGVVAVGLLWAFLAPAISVVGVVIALLVLRGWLRRGQERRREAFITQMPELARVVANATHAGLSIATAIAVAAEEMSDPARTELKRVYTRLSFGTPLETALTELRTRIASREVSVLVSTLLVSARSGGSLVTSLRTIADTLEQRRETRREVRTILSQSVATGYTVLGLGLAVLPLLNLLSPGTVETMTREPVGIAALVAAGLLFALGLVVIRAMTRIED